MKMVKSLLLGSAAGMVAIAGAQAADLPVKAKPVQYVKICTLYGDGFYYIPGSDTCIRFSGYIRADYGYNVTGARTRAICGCGRCAGPHGQQLLDPASWQLLGRHADADCLRHAADVPDLSTCRTRTRPSRPTSSRAFIQWGGFTFGRTVSFTDHEGSIGDSGMRSLHQTQNQSDTGANGTNQIAYTWQLGNGVTLNVGADERRVKSIANLSRAAAPSSTQGVDPTSSRAGSNHPNPWVSLRVNQAWGRASVAVIANHNEATYYTATRGGACPGGNTGTTLCGYPDDKWGWAVISGTEIKLDMLSPGSRIGGYFNYGVGAIGLRRRQQPREPRPLWQRQPDCVRRGHRRGLHQRLGHRADHGVDGRWRVRILLDPQLLQHDLRQLHRGQLQQHRGQQPLVLRRRQCD